MDHTTLWKLYNTLCQIKVSGEEDMGRLLGCINLIKAEIKRQEDEANGAADRQTGERN